jgi:flagellar basal-body rod protein FlgB
MQILKDSFGIHEKALQVRNQRMELIARNISNSDTPHFKARDLDFRKAMDDAMRPPIQATQGAHFRTGDIGGADALRYRVPFNASADGNTVEMSVEQARYGKAAADYQATLMFLEQRIGGIRKALRGE